jgi:deazaflavin-dependent oxidoreductase (nitroreductase family)
MKRYRVTLVRRIGNALITALLRLGVPLPHTYLLTTKGRRTGLTRSTPVTLIEDHEPRYLVAPYGAVSWVHNARAAGTVTLSRKRRSHTYRVRELSAGEAAPVLERYLRENPVTQVYFGARRDSPLHAFEAEAGRHPAFALEAVDARVPDERRQR